MLFWNNSVDSFAEIRNFNTAHYFAISGTNYANFGTAGNTQHSSIT